MIFHSSIRREMSRTFGATVVVVTLTVMTMLLVRTLGLASRGSVDPTEVMMVLGYTALGHSPTILTLSLFISVVGTISRMYRDSEMVIWFSSGRGLAGFLQPLARFAWLILLTIALLALFARPWSQQQTEILRDRFEQRSDLERVAPGRFQESAGGNRVFFVDKDSITDKTAGEVFIATNEKGKQTITSARAGRIEDVGPDRFLLLFNGQRLETSLEKPGSKLSEFEQFGLLVQEKARAVARAVRPWAVSTRTLIIERTPAYLGELSWRLGLVLAAFNFVLFGLALSSSTPRFGRNSNLVLSLFAFVAYYNFVTVGQSWIATGASTFWRFMLVLHGGAFVLATLMLLKLDRNWTLASSLRRRRRTASMVGGGP